MLTFGQCIIQDKAVLDGGCRTVAEHTAAFYATASGKVVCHYTVNQTCSLKHRHTCTAGMCVVHVGQESVANSEAVPINCIILLVIRVLMPPVNRSASRFDIGKTALFDDTFVVG